MYKINLVIYGNFDIQKNSTNHSKIYNQLKIIYCLFSNEGFIYYQASLEYLSLEFKVTNLNQYI